MNGDKKKSRQSVVLVRVLAPLGRCTSCTNAIRSQNSISVIQICSEFRMMNMGP